MKRDRSVCHLFRKSSVRVRSQLPVLPSGQGLSSRNLPTGLLDNVCQRGKLSPVPKYPNNLLAIRNAKGWGKAEAARRAGVDPGHYGRVESGSRKLNSDLIGKFVKGWGTTPEEIVRQGGFAPPESLIEVWNEIRADRQPGVLAILRIIATWDGRGDEDGEGIPIRGTQLPEDRGPLKRASSSGKEASRKQQ